jgi:hypothetical protein
MSAKKRNRALRATGASSLNRVCSAMWLEGSAIGPVLVDHRMTDNGERVIVLKLDQLDGHQKAVLKKIGLWSMSDTRPTPPNADVPTSVCADNGANVGEERGACSLPRRVRLRVPRRKAGCIKVQLANDRYNAPDWWVVWEQPADKATARLCCDTLSKLGDELRERGYDPTTLRFSISKPNARTELPPPDSDGGSQKKESNQ